MIDSQSILLNRFHIYQRIAIFIDFVEIIFSVVIEHDVFRERIEVDCVCHIIFPVCFVVFGDDDYRILLLGRAYGKRVYVTVYHIWFYPS